jgi:hypothetical protein
MVDTQPIHLKDLPTKCQLVDNNSRRPKLSSQDMETPVVLAHHEEVEVAVLPHTEVEITLGTLQTIAVPLLKLNLLAMEFNEQSYKIKHEQNHRSEYHSKRK